MMNNNSPFQITTQDTVSRRMTILMWGPAGSGKTTWAATAPGKKLWLSFGDNEHQAVMERKDVAVMPLYKHSYDEVIKHGRSDNPFNLDHILHEDKDIETVVCDSVTALTDM